MNPLQPHDLSRARHRTGIRQIPTRLAIAALTLAATFAFASPALAAERAVMSWDTDDTDVDLHVWDASGRHAYYNSRSAIPGSNLSTDIRYGFGPEQFEEFQGQEGRQYTYGVCYYGSNRGDGSVPTTTVTVTLSDPDGRQRTLRRVLSSEKEAYYLGASPQGGGHRPAEGWCSGGPYHADTDPGPATDPGAGRGGAFDQCERTRRRVGNIELCADEVTGRAPEYTARGNVRVNGSISLGDGAATIDTDAHTVTALGTVVAVQRAGGTIPLAAGDVRITGEDATEPISGRTGLATMEIGAIRPQLEQLRVAGLPLTLGDLTGDSLTTYIDPRDGGGVIAGLKVKLPLAGDLASADELAVGVHGRSASAVRVLGGTASFGEVTLPGGWRFNGLKLTYQEQGNTWTAEGGLQTPAFGLDLSGGLADGRLDSLGIAVSRDVPLGTSGFILTKVGGSVAGLANPPLKISATASAKWGSLPGTGAGILFLNDVTLTVDVSGAAGFTGGVEFLYRGSRVGGRLDLDFRLDPFRASGRLHAEASRGPLSITADAGIVLTRRAFTATGAASGSLRGLKLASGRGVVSDRGIGATGEVCIGAFGRCAKRVTLGAGMNWSDFPSIRWIGGDVQRFVTASRRSGRRTITVPTGRPLLFVDATGAAGSTPEFTVRSPSGRTYTTGRQHADSTVVRDPELGYTGLTIIEPEAGRWTVIDGAGPAARVDVQTIRRVQRLRVTRVTPAGIRRRPIRRKGAPVRVSWTSRGLPRSARVTIYVTRDPARPGTQVGSPRRTRGSAGIPRRLLARGVNRVRLVVSDRGVGVDDVLARTTIRAK